MRQLAAALAATLAAALAVPASHAQDADTLDWKRYYPLAVGNVWEYHGAEAQESFTRVALVADTTVGDRTYFRRRTDTAVRAFFASGPDTLRSTTFDLVRYGDGGVLAVRTIEADTVGLAICSEDDGFERDLRAAFGTGTACPPTTLYADSVWVEGAYDARWAPQGVGELGPFEAVDVAAIKDYSTGVIFSTFVADVGPVSTGNLWGPRLHYARIGGVEYGAPSVLVAGDRQPEGARPTVRVLGNPVRREARFALDAPPARDAWWTVTDALGRTVRTARVAGASPGAVVRVPTVGLAPGVYRFTLDADGARASVAFTVVQ